LFEDLLVESAGQRFVGRQVGRWRRLGSGERRGVGDRGDREAGSTEAQDRTPGRGDEHWTVEEIASSQAHGDSAPFGTQRQAVDPSAER
jgi:hypothetical protein